MHLSDFGLIVSDNIGWNKDFNYQQRSSMFDLKMTVSIFFQSHQIYNCEKCLKSSPRLFL